MSTDDVDLLAGWLASAAEWWCQDLPPGVKDGTADRVRGAALSAVMILNGSGGAGQVSLRKTGPGGRELAGRAFAEGFGEHPAEAEWLQLVETLTARHETGTRAAEAVNGFMADLAAALADEFEVRLIAIDATGAPHSVGPDIAGQLPAALHRAGVSVP